MEASQELPHPPYRRRRNSLFLPVVQGVGGGQAAVRPWFPPAGKSLFFRRTASGQGWLPGRAVIWGPREKGKCTKKLNDTHTYICAHKKKILFTYVFLLHEVWRRVQTAAGWLHWPLSSWHHESLTAGRKKRRVINACVHADAVAFISVVVKTDLHVLYLVTTRQKKMYLRVKPAAKYGNHIIKSDWRISRENISGLIRKATYLVLDSDMRQHTQHYMGPLKKKNTSCLTSHYLIPSSDAT